VTHCFVVAIAIVIVVCFDCLYGLSSLHYFGIMIR